MPSLAEKIQSLSSNVGGVYRKPPPELLDKLKESLFNTEKAIDYLRISRNLTDDTIKHFQLGYDESKNAIAIPIFKRGELINIKYRLLEPSTHKYTQEKDCEVWIYNEDGIQQGMKKGALLIVEGEFDLMSCWQAGIKNVVSPASGKDSYGVWLELIDNIPKVWISYDNDKSGKETALKLAERIGVEKCMEIIYPTQEVKDANDYFKKFSKEDYIELIKNARPFYSYQFNGIGDVINDLRFNKKDIIRLKHLPEVKLGQDWLVVISGKSNVGKTSYAMNLVNELVQNQIPTLVLPFERGVQVVGARFLQVKYNLSEGDIESMEEKDWEPIVKETVNVPLYFAMPTKNEVFDVIRKSKRIFDTRVVVVDHLDYMIRNSQHKEQEIGNTLQELKRIAEENKIIMFVITHIRKIEQAGAQQKKKPGIEDLKGSSSLYQDPECVVMLSGDEEHLEVDVVKNKGKMSSQAFFFNKDSGTISQETLDGIGFKASQKALEDFNSM